MIEQLHVHRVDKYDDPKSMFYRIFKSFYLSVLGNAFCKDDTELDQLDHKKTPLV